MLVLVIDSDVRHSEPVLCEQGGKAEIDGGWKIGRPGRAQF